MKIILNVSRISNQTNSPKVVGVAFVNVDIPIGNTIYTLFQYCFKIALLINYIICKLCDTYYRLQQSWWL